MFIDAFITFYYLFLKKKKKKERFHSTFTLKIVLAIFSNTIVNTKHPFTPHSSIFLESVRFLHRSYHIFLREGRISGLLENWITSKNQTNPLPHFFSLRLIDTAFVTEDLPIHKLLITSISSVSPGRKLEIRRRAFEPCN